MFRILDYRGAIFAGVFVLGLSPATGDGEEARLPAYNGVARCKLCHDRQGSDLDRSEQELVLRNELLVWTEQDAHSKAFHSLTTPLAARIGDRLDIDVQTDRSCLSCHATLYHGELPPADELRQGVACEQCHGPSEKWFDPHIKPDLSWRRKTAAEKASYGMVDMRDPTSRAEKCISCHIGSVPERRMVTHDMYAAGHPVLPSFELQTFLDRMPPHWRPTSRKSAAVQDAFKLAYGYDPLERTRTKTVMLGGLLALRRSRELFTVQAAASDGGSAGWPELSHYDCAACHHELRETSWRAARGYVGPPGRPRLQLWPEVLPRLGLRLVERRLNEQQPAATRSPADARLPQLLAPLNQALLTTPFGDPRAIGNPSREGDVSYRLLSGLDRAAERLAQTRCDEQAARETLFWLCNTSDPQSPSAALLDYHSARQILWGASVIYGELVPDASADDQIRRLLSDLDAELVSGRPGMPAVDTASWLSGLNRYDAVRFRANLGRLRELLSR